MTDLAAPAEEPVEREPSLPVWYDPNRPLLAFIDGPRAGSWEYADSWEELRRLAKIHGETKRTGRTLAYQPVSADDPDRAATVTHRLDERITAQAMTWTGRATRR